MLKCLLILFGAIFGVIVICMWFVAAPAAVAERLGPFAALSRSAQLTTGRRGGIFGLTFLLGLIVVIAIMAYVMPMANDPGHGDPYARIKQAALVIAIGLCVFNTFMGIVEAVSYALLRQDKDGVTHEELARVFE